MCGFLGAFAPKANPWLPDEVKVLREASSRLAHRGNTSSGERIQGHFALLHHRLAFRDVAEGKQPLTDSRGRATIIYNGELYGFHKLRQQLSQMYDFRTKSDTEVILAAWLVHGENLLSHLDGEYAFVIYDHRDGRVVAGRDPFGVKPLFFTGEGLKASLRHYAERYEISGTGKLFFASEMKGLPGKLQWDHRGLDRLMLSLFEEMGTAFRDVYQLAPGSLLVATPTEAGYKATLERKIFKRRRPQRAPEESFEENAARLKEILRETVQSKLDSEVPLGAYLSGGIDSRIAAFEMGRSGARIETFTVGFEGADYDETTDVAAFLRRYPNLRGRALRTTDKVLEYSYPHAVYASELVQPYTNGAAKWWLSRFARRHVRGVLTGDGADELFCGYPSYKYLAWWRFQRRRPSLGRAKLFAARVVGKSEKFWEKGLSTGASGKDLLDAAQDLGWLHPLYAQVQSAGGLWAGSRFAEIVRQEKEAIHSYVAQDEGLSPMNIWQNYFLHTHFPTHVLNWVGDRMEMANTLEGRPIFLSAATRLFMQRMPDAWLVRGMRDKAVLRRAYRDDLGPFSLTPKKQFNAPFLLQGRLGKEFLGPKALIGTGLIDPARVAKAEKLLATSQDELEKSFARIFLQNCLVAQMLDRYLVRGEPPAREIEFEEKFLDKHTVDL